MSRFGHLKTLPQGPFRFIAIDVETAGRTIDSICQIGLCCVEGGGTLHTYSTLVNPESKFEPFNIELHGIGPDTVRDAPTFPQAFAALGDLLNTYPLVQHSRYDEKAMGAACKKYALPRITSKWSDSVQIARKAWPELKGNGGHGLGNLKEVFGLNFHHHDAGEDARASATVVLLAEAAMEAKIAALTPSPQLTFDFAALSASLDSRGTSSSG